MSSRCPICTHGHLAVVVMYDEPPAGETDFGIADYRREYRRCTFCGHLSGWTSVNLGDLYEKGYVDATYARQGLTATFERIMSLPPGRSDNVQRVRRIEDFWRRAERSVLDVGSGLAVFAARMKEAGWNVTALDPDPRAVAFARERVGVGAVEGDFLQVDALQPHALLTFNKVLEHVPDPVTMLQRSHAFLDREGIVYLEVPDGERAARDPTEGFAREEFFIEHLHVFSAASTALLADRAGFDVIRLERLREPSGKYTIFAFIEARRSAGPGS